MERDQDSDSGDLGEEKGGPWWEQCGGGLTRWVGVYSRSVS